MNVMRSPTGSDTSMERSGSHPNLTTAGASSEMSGITFRYKRKHNDVDQIQLADIQKQMMEMMALLTTSINAQKESSTKITNDIASIKEQMHDIKNGMDTAERKITSMAADQIEIKAEVQSLANAVRITEGKVASLEADLQNTRVVEIDRALQNKPSYEEILAELNDQNARKKNILIIGIPESKSIYAKERSAYDKAEVLKIIKPILENCPEPIRVLRVGKYNVNKNRSIKVCYESDITTKTILKDKHKLQNSTIKIFSDQTPFMQAKFKKLKEELNRRNSNGEQYLTIKYLKGIPQIVSAPPKNSVL